MKIVRFSAAGIDECCGVLENNVVRAFEGKPWENRASTGEEFSIEQIRLLPPICNPPDIFAIGLNYRAHADETGKARPNAPVVFLKASSSVVGPDSTIFLPKQAPNEVDYEAELALVIGKTCRNACEEEAFDYLLGCTCGNDVSARDAQMKLDVQWARGKSFETFCPIGPWIETQIDPDNAGVKSYLNGELMQCSNTSDLIFSCSKLISYISEITTLKPGTIIMTGTPSGVGVARNPQVFLRDGDTIEIEIDGVGKLVNTIAKA